MTLRYIILNTIITNFYLYQDFFILYIFYKLPRFMYQKLFRKNVLYAILLHDSSYVAFFKIYYIAILLRHFVVILQKADILTLPQLYSNVAASFATDLQYYNVSMKLFCNIFATFLCCMGCDVTCVSVTCVF